MWMPWAMTSLALVVVAFLSYALGARHEVVINDDAVRHGWIGFPFFTFFLFFWLFGCFRRMWWWGGGYYRGRPWRYRRYYDDPDDDREMEEWHRREHERMDQNRSRSAADQRQ